MGLEQDIRDQVSAALGEEVVVDEVRVTPAGKRRVARITVERLVESAVGDTPIETLTLDEIADATRLISEALDASDVMGAQPYTLEVSTPGVDRPLTEPEHFRRSIGRLVTLTLGDGERTGRVLATTDEGVDLAVTPVAKPGAPTKPPTPEHLPFADITKGIAQVEFSRAQSTPADQSTPTDIDDETKA